MNTFTEVRSDPSSLVPVTEFRSFIDGAVLEAPGNSFDLLDPATGRQWGENFVSSQSVDAAVSSAETAFFRSGWAERSGWQRAEALNKLADLILEHQAVLAAYETLATGKPINATTAEIAYATRWYRYYAAAAETRREAYIGLGPDKDAQIRNEPIGVVAAITPFNGAFSLGTWKIAPALAAGNSVVVKPPLQSVGSTLLLARLAVEAGIPAGVLNVVIGDAEEGQQIAADDRIGLVTFTGSTAVAGNIGSAVSRRMGRFMCEAGGKSAHVIMDDADIESAVIAATQGVFSGSGQTCVAGSRLLIHQRVHDEFLERFVAHSSKLLVGDPLNSDTHLGPIATGRQRDSIQGFIDRSLEDGAEIVLGKETPLPGGDLDGGFWVPPTILTNVSADMEICREEVFGPVAAVQSVGSLEEAVSTANASRYGLAAGIWTANQSAAHYAARTFQAGTVWINTYRGMDWRTPFGGYKQSGLGRENGIEGLMEFTQAKTVVQDYKPAADPFNLV